MGMAQCSGYTFSGKVKKGDVVPVCVKVGNAIGSFQPVVDEFTLLDLHMSSCKFFGDGDEDGFVSEIFVICSSHSTPSL